MTPENARLEQARSLLAIAFRDLRVARKLADSEPEASLFHAQQSVEKAAKGFLAAHGAVFRKTHDLKELGVQCAGLRPSLTAVLQDCADLTDYAVVFRYFDAPQPPTEADALAAINNAQRLYDEVLAALAL